MTTAKIAKKFKVTNGPGLWNLLIEGLAQGRWQTFTIGIKDGTAFKSASFDANIVSVEWIDHLSQLWRVTCQVIQDTGAKVQPGFKPQGPVHLQKTFDLGLSLTFVYSTLKRRGELESSTE